MAMLTAEQCPSQIVERIVRIVNEKTVSEVVIWNWESYRERYHKKRVLLFTDWGLPSSPA